MDMEKTIPSKELAALCRQAAAEGAVLLKNEEGMLPLTPDERVAVFGRCQIDYYRSGTGSGGMVHAPYLTNLLDELENSGQVKVDEIVAGSYREWVKEHPFDRGDGTWACEPWFQEEMPVTESFIKEAAGRCDKAVIVIGRTAGEDKDNADVPGSYRLTPAEEMLTELVLKHFSKTAVLFNVSNIMDMRWTLDKPGLKAILYAWQGGMEGGRAAADVLTGKVNPSGGLPDTIAYQLEDYPAYCNFGNEDINFYEEDIYVGYRYFETFAKDRVLYPFGYGLSYTTFSHEVIKAKVQGEGKDAQIQLSIRVTNTGSAAGKKSLQIYGEAPQGVLGKPARVLLDFTKTHLLAPGEAEELIFSVPLKRLASYDDGGATGHRSCYVLEAGEYRFYAGWDCREAEEISKDGKALLTLEQTVITEKYEEACAPILSFGRMKPGKRTSQGDHEITYEKVPLRTVDLKKRILDNLPKQLPEPKDKKAISFAQVRDGETSLEEFTAQLSVSELATIVRGEGMCNMRVTPGTAAAFGGISDELAKRGIPAGCASDGPSGIRLDTGDKTTQLPIGTLIASSFDSELIEELFYLEGQELYYYGVDTLLGPGINIHRYLLNGRNFEYFSEDPYLTGRMAAACIKGLRRAGVTGTLKHFAGNNQELARHTVDTVVSERALREIYLKGFEMAVKEGGANSIMTTYNPLNGCQNSCQYDLNTWILRKEWGFTGIVMTDWWAKLDDVMTGANPNRTDTASMVRAQNDVYMVVKNNGAAQNASGDNTEQALKEGRLTIGELQRSAMNILRFLLEVPAGKREVNLPGPIELRARTACEGTAKPLSQGIHFANGEPDTWCLQVEEDGIYQCKVSYLSTQSELAQMFCLILLNGKTAGCLQTNGTGGRRQEQKISEVILQKGFYTLDIRHVLAGIELLSIEFPPAGQ